MLKFRNVLFLVFALVFSSVCFSDMTIYFKDGSSRLVRKIQFRNEQADLYLANGMILTVSAETIDLASSGIVNAEGTYGSSEISPVTPRNAAIPASSNNSEQSRLKDQWDGSTDTAVALDNYGSAQKGDVVKIVLRKGSTVSIILKCADGTYKKLLIDSSSFYENFEIQKLSERIAARTAPSVLLRTSEAESENSEPSASAKETALSPVIPDTVNSVAGESTVRASLTMPLIAAATCVVAVIGLAWLMIRKRSSFTIDSSRLSRVENELRQYSLRNWLNQGKTTKELVELCLNRIFEENPKALGLGLKIVDGEPKSLVIAAVLRDKSKTVAQAELIYDQLKSAIDGSRSLIQEVSAGTGMFPVDQRVPQSVAVPGGIARAAIAGPYVPAGFASARIEIVHRPVTITVCAILLYLSAAVTAVLLFGDFPGLEKLREAIGRPGLVIAVAYTLLCGYGYMTMRKWAVLLYGLEPLLRWWADVPGHLIAIPLFIVCAGMIYFDNMTWK